VLLTDSTVIRLHPELADDYPGAWANHSPAAAKLTVVTDLGSRCIQRLKISPGSHHDVHHLEPGEWLRDTLLIADRAFTACWRLREIDAVGGFYIGSIRANTNPIIVDTRTGLPRSVIGRRVRTVERLARGNELDVVVDLVYQRRNESGVLKVLTHRCRLIGRRRQETGAFDYWITNLPPSTARPVDVASLYASRWDIEIFFRELKTTWRADQIPTSGKAATECLLYASILAVLLSRVLHSLLLDSQQARSAPAERWARLVRVVAADMAILVAQSSSTARDALAQHARLLRHEGRDPNRKRHRPGDCPLPSTLLRA
jgi:IS4 transposase